MSNEMTCVGTVHPGGVGLPAGIGPCSPPEPSQDKPERGVVFALKRVGTISSVLSTPPVILKAFPGENTSNTQPTPP